MVNTIALRFLGTSSQTNVTRNYSSLLVKLDHHSVMVDCGEATQRQLQNRYIGGEEKLGSIRRILITHLHMDHVSGIVPLLCAMMGPSNFPSTSEKVPRVEIYGPSGLRALIRTTLTLCYSTLSGYYTVHELLWPGQLAYPNESLLSTDEEIMGASVPESLEPLLGATNGPQRVIPHLPPHENELPGRDFRLDEETASWPHIANIDGVSISAAPILHRCPTVGYVFDEPATSSTSATPEMMSALKANATALQEEQDIRNPLSLLGRVLKDRQSVKLPDGTTLHPPTLDVRGRKVVVLGDTYDATAGLETPSNFNETGLDRAQRGMLGLAQDADLLIHECTNAALPGTLQQGNKKNGENRDEVRAKALLRGHSTPQVAGLFAGKCGVRQLLLNHLSVKYPAPAFNAAQLYQDNPGKMPRDEGERRYLAIREIEDQATETWHDSMINRQRIHTKSAQARRAIVASDGFYYPVIRFDQVEESPMDDATIREQQAYNPSSEASSVEYSGLRNRHGLGSNHSSTRGRGTAPSRNGRGPFRGSPRRRGSASTSPFRQENVRGGFRGRPPTGPAAMQAPSSSYRGRGRGGYYSYTSDFTPRT